MAFMDWFIRTVELATARDLEKRMRRHRMSVTGNLVLLSDEDLQALYLAHGRTEDWIQEIRRQVADEQERRAFEELKRSRPKDQ